MNETKEPSLFAKANQWARKSISLKLLVIGILILIMLIPVSMIDDLIYERSYRKDEAYQTESMTWGGAQQISGPILMVPIEEDSKVNDISQPDGFRIVTTKSMVTILPEELDYTGELEPVVSERGIYDLIMYQGEIGLTGNYKPLKIADLDEGGRVLWDQATVLVGISQLKGLKEQVQLSINGAPLAFESGTKYSKSLSSGVHAPVDLSELWEKGFSFEGNLSLRGSRTFTMLPLGKSTTAEINSTWSDPKFMGDFPTDRTATTYGEDGFKGVWQVQDLNRHYPQQFRDAQNVSSASFGVNLFHKLDHYGLNKRAAKYAVLIISLIFMAFFFMQIIFKRSVHAIQFLLVGLSLTLFYTLLLSFSEHVGFSMAYLIAAGSIVLLNAFYIRAIFGAAKPALIGAIIIALLYVFIYVILQMEDFALLTGSVGLLLLLAYAMYLTRNLDWFSSNKEDENNAIAAA